MKSIGDVAAAKAAVEAKRFEREYWLEKLELGLAEGTDGTYVLSDFDKGYLEYEIKRLKRVLGEFKTSEESRAATKKRVRQHRERWRQEKIKWRKPRKEQAAKQWYPTNSGAGGGAAAFKYLLKQGTEPTAEAIDEFFKGAMTKVEILLALSDLQSAKHLDRIRVEVENERA
jgi:hypothetical protein